MQDMSPDALSPFAVIHTCASRVFYVATGGDTLWVALTLLFRTLLSLPSCHRSAMSLALLSTGLTVTYTRTNGCKVAATVVAPSECGHYVAVEYDIIGGHVSHPCLRQM